MFPHDRPNNATDGEGDPRPNAEIRRASKFLRRLKRELSMPAFSPSAERPTSPGLFAARSADAAQKGGGGVDRSGGSGPAVLNPAPSWHNGLRFSKGRRGRRCADDGATLQQLHSEDSLNDAGSCACAGGVPAADDSSRQLNLLWEDDPDSKSRVFLSLLNIENAD
jgi:hypothetical protein